MVLPMVRLSRLRVIVADPRLFLDIDLGVHHIRSYSESVSFYALRTHS